MLRTFTHALVALAVTSTAAAGPFDQDPRPLYGDAPDTPTMSATADDWLRIGLARYEAGDFKGAIDAFLAGNQLDPRPAFLFAIAQAERRRGDCAAAIVYYERFLASSPPESQAAAARDQRDRCEHAVGSTPLAEPTLPAPTVVIAALPAAPAPAPRATRRWWQDPVADSLAGGAVVLSAVGVALIASARGLADDAATAPTYDDHAALRDRAVSRHAAGLVTLSAGLVAGAAAAIVWWKPWADRAIEVRPGPGAGVAVAGAW